MTFPLPLPAGWAYVTIHTQAEADALVPGLLHQEAVGRAVFCVPRERIDLTAMVRDVDGFEEVTQALAGIVSYDGQVHAPCPKVSWLCVAGEVGPHAAPCHPKWVRSLRDQCKDAGVPFCFLGFGEWGVSTMVPAERALVGIRWEPGMQEGLADEIIMYRVGKDTSGRRLDGKVWDERPTEVS